MSTDNDKPQDDNIQQSEWRSAREQEHEENEQLRTRIADLERSAASAREIARVAMTHTGTQAVRVELCAREGQLSLIICDPRGAEFEDSIGVRIVDLLQASGLKFGSRNQIGSSE